MSWSRRGFALGCLISALCARPRLADTAPAASLAGQLLVAPPDMIDPRFARAVILMVRHDDQGALGLILNRPLGEKTLAEILTAIGGDPADAQGSIAIFEGGPVEPARGFVVHSAEYRIPGTVVPAAGVAVTGSLDLLRAIATGKGPRRRMLMLGYAGWAPGQLEAEMFGRDWGALEARPDLVFDTDRGKLWRTVRAQETETL
ncbi:MAG TPA: YqgE/AlgH family protein [Acetobacteraceae bacterium]|nr:YqgE/AlgH family protein [Acetobacteraceae bacterium]